MYKQTDLLKPFAIHFAGRTSLMDIAEDEQQNTISLQPVRLFRSCAEVMLVRHKNDGTVYAMKMLRKDNVVKSHQVEHTKTERNVLETVSHPFIVNLLSAAGPSERLGKLDPEETATGSYRPKGPVCRLSYGG